MDLVLRELKEIISRFSLIYNKSIAYNIWVNSCLFAESIIMEAKLERDLEEEEQRCEDLKQMCKEEEEELTELDVLGEELEVRINAFY